MKSVRLRVSSFLGAALRKGMQPGGFTKLFLCLCVFVLLGAAAPVVNWFTLEKDKKAPSDYGYGPDKPIGIPRPKVVLAKSHPARKPLPLALLLTVPLLLLAPPLLPLLLMAVAWAVFLAQRFLGR